MYYKILSFFSPNVMICHIRIVETGEKYRVPEKIRYTGRGRHRHPGGYPQSRTNERLQIQDSSRSDEALANLIEKHREARSCPHVMTSYLGSHLQFQGRGNLPVNA
jgi:hypothetical protein